jgi:hypothetical protein
MPEPVDLAVRHERKDASIGMAAVFAATLIGVLIVGHLVLYWMLGAMERRQHADRERGPQQSPIARENREHFPAHLNAIRDQYRSPALQVADIHDMDVQRAAEDAVLKSHGWSNPSKGAVRIPIAEALRLIQDPATAKAHGISAREIKESP